jgi:uncharacterized protein
VASPLLINIIEMTRRAGTLKNIEITIPVSTFDFADKRLDDATEIEIALQLESINGGIIVQGTVAGKSQLLCGRCLRNIEFANVASIDEMYQRVPDNPDAYPIEGESLDLQPMVREMVLLSLPDTPLCKADCPGLCPQCGADLQIAPCGCQAQRFDERWAILDQLREELN